MNNNYKYNNKNTSEPSEIFFGSFSKESAKDGGKDGGNDCPKKYAVQDHSMQEYLL